MPKGKHKGGRRQFTNFEALEEQKKKEEKEKQWRKTQGEESEDEEGAEKKSDESSSESSSEEEEVNMKPKGVSALIETDNPNRIVHKPKKVSQMSATPPAAAATGSSKPQLSRREREEIEKQKATAHYRKMHAEGKTEEARADLARLAIIKQQREEAAKKKEDERVSREQAAAAKKDKMAKALNKKS